MEGTLLLPLLVLKKRETSLSRPVWENHWENSVLLKPWLWLRATPAPSLGPATLTFTPAAQIKPEQLFHAAVVCVFKGFWGRRGTLCVSLHGKS